MATHLETIIKELADISNGIQKVMSMFAEADHAIQNSVGAATRGGFTAMRANLTAAHEQLRQLRTVLNAAGTELGQAAGPVAGAPKEIDATQLQTVLAPLPTTLGRVRGTLMQASAGIPRVVQQVAASANQNPAIPILTNANQQVLTPTVQRLDAVTTTVSAAVTEAKTARSGE